MSDDAFLVGCARIAEALDRVAQSLSRLGLADASTGMGAMELLAMEVRDGCARIAVAMEGEYGGSAVEESDDLDQ